LALTRLVRALPAGALGRGVRTPAPAHSLLLESTPAADSTVAVAPPTLSLRFNNRVEKLLSRLRLSTAHGELVRLATPASDGTADRLSVPLPALAPGAYRVEGQGPSPGGPVLRGGLPLPGAPPRGGGWDRPPAPPGGGAPREPRRPRGRRARGG